MPLATDYPFLDVVGTMLVFFGWVIWFWLLITVFSDLFSRHDISGWGKAAWCIFAIVLPFIGVLVYLGFQGKHMAERRASAAEAAQKDVDQYVRRVAGSEGPTGQIAQGKALLDSGAIDQAEFDALKKKALAS